MKLRVLPYKTASTSAKELVHSLGPTAILKSQRSSVPSIVLKKVLLNWGHSSPAFSLTGVTVLNKPDAVANASNKLTALRMMKEGEVNVPDFTTDRSVAEAWIEEERIVLCRTLLRANSGRGITIAKELGQLIDAPLYVKYIRKEKEYRVHVFNGQVIDMIEKAKRSGFQTNPLYNKYIRSYEQGWIFKREGIEVSDEVKEECIKAVRVLGLDFGAVDVIINRDNLPVVLEVNTAPGLMGTTLDCYKAAVLNWLRTVR